MTLSRFILITIASILLAETIVLFYLSGLGPLSMIEKALFSTSVITLIIIPILYYRFFKPMRLLIAECKRTEDKLQSLSLTDGLTGLYSRQGFITLADHQLELARRQKMITFLLYTDLNNLKEINDTFGLKEGENALSDIASILKTTYRKSDIIARLGEDEFVVYPVGTTDTGTHARIAADRFQNNLDMHNRGSKMNYELSASVHISSIDINSALSFDEILLQAD